MPPALDDWPREAGESPWCLGIDIGTTGISAVLLHRVERRLYPLYWQRLEGASTPRLGRRFRLPATVQYVQNGQGGSLDILASFADQPPQAPPHGSASLQLDSLKPYLNLAIPHYSPQTEQWEPVLQWSNSQAITLSWIYQTLLSLLATLNQRSPSTSLWQMAPRPMLVCGAVGLADEQLHEALRQTAVVLVGCPADWTEAYRFNIREALLGARLVSRPQQVLFVDEAIATLLSELRSADAQPITLPSQLSHKPQLYSRDWQGHTLIINGGAAVTELALVNLPGANDPLTHTAFLRRTLPYAGHALDQDIVCQILYPLLCSRVPAQQALQDFLTQLDLATVDFPSVGEPDLVKRHRLQQRLRQSAQGLECLAIARRLKVHLQHKTEDTFELAGQTWSVTRPDLGSRIFLPYIQRLKRDINALLEKQDIQPAAIQQIICSGGTASLRMVALWLREKFANATIVQDTYGGDRPSPHHDALSTCSRVAYGLAALPLHPHLLESLQQTCEPYHLLALLLQMPPDVSLSLEAILSFLQEHGIDPERCHQEVLAILESHLPAGLVPTAPDQVLLTVPSWDYMQTQLSSETPLFQPMGDRLYHANAQQWQRLHRYLHLITTSTRQKFFDAAGVSFTLHR
ncbi:MAG: hypothetical protein VKK04_26895 [Synechococcales bacterium]|nr:hypothetical protein [Synechococcales bacterium]